MYDVELVAELLMSGLRAALEIEMAQDMRPYDEAKRNVAEGEELIPSEITYALARWRKSGARLGVSIVS